MNPVDRMEKENNISVFPELFLKKVNQTIL